MPEPIKVFCRHCHAKLDVTDLKPFSLFDCPICGARLRAPQRFDRYLLEKVCGIGGISKVYRALDPERKRRVAVKIIEPEFNEPGVAERLLEEANIVSRINSPGIVPVYGAGVFEDRPFLVMRYMENSNLELRLKHQTLAPRQVLGWLLTVAEGLKAALAQSIVHHDIKPGNILLDRDNQAYLSDFDLAEIQLSRDQVQPCTGWASPGYVSPERLIDGRETFKGDIFSFGVSCYELLSTVAPFGHEPEEAQKLLERRRHPDYAPLHDIQPLVSLRFSELVDRMLAYEPDDRPDYDQILAGIVEELRPEFTQPDSFWSRLINRFKLG